MTASVTQITSAIASGDPVAFAQFFDQWSDWVLAEARRISRRDEAACLDILQDTMLRVMRSLPVLSHPTQLEAWMRRAVHSVAIDEFRRTTRRLRRERTRTAPVTHDDGHDELAETRDQLLWLRSEMRGLDDELREMVLLRHRFGWSLRRIAATFGLKTGAVDGRLRRAISQLRTRAKEAFRDEAV